MEIIPAIDLKNGQCVRLIQGDFATATIYNPDPLHQAKAFFDAGANWLHVVDLDGARAGAMQQFDLIARLAEESMLKIQVGGGIRDAALIERLLAAKVHRVVIGSLAVKEPATVTQWLERFGPERIVLAFDVRMNQDHEAEILTHGWQTGSKQSLWPVLDDYADSNLQTILCTDVGRDGMLGGSNHALYIALQQKCPDLAVLASGGVSGLADLMQLAKLGLAGAITGKAIYEGRIDLGAAIRQVAHVG